MSEFETFHRLHFLFYYKTKCKFQFEIEKVAKNKSSLPKIGCFEVKRVQVLNGRSTFFPKLNFGL